MLRIQEICKAKGITMQTLAKKMNVSYQALYASVSGNPTLAKLSELANVLEVDITDLFEPKAGNLTALIDYEGKFHHFNNIESLERFVLDIKKNSKEEAL